MRKTREEWQEEFLQMVATLTQEEQRELWNELERCGLIRKIQPSPVLACRFS